MQVLRKHFLICFLPAVLITFLQLTKPLEIQKNDVYDMGINQLIALEAEMVNQYRGVSGAMILAGYSGRE